MRKRPIARRSDQARRSQPLVSMLLRVAQHPSLAAMSRVSGVSTQKLRELLDKHGLRDRTPR